MVGDLASRGGEGPRPRDEPRRQAALLLEFWCWAVCRQARRAMESPSTWEVGHDLYGAVIALRQLLRAAEYCKPFNEDAVAAAVDLSSRPLSQDP